MFVLSLAYANGANDVSKGVATLVGGGVTTYRRGLAWGTLWTVAGALLGLVVSVGLVRMFTTDLLVAPPDDELFPLAVAAARSAGSSLRRARGYPSRRHTR